MFSWQGCRFIGLNILRALSLVALILVFVSNILLIVHDFNIVNNSGDSSAQVTTGTNTTGTNTTGTNTTHASEGPLEYQYVPGSTVPNTGSGLFWATGNRILLLLQILLLIFSEIGWPNAFFARFLPPFSDDYGVAPIGVLECLIGAQVNSHAVDKFSMTAAFFLFAIGCIYFILAVISDKRIKAYRAILSWRDREVLPKTSADLANVATESAQVSPSLSTKSIFGRQGEKAFRAPGAATLGQLDQLA